MDLVITIITAKNLKAHDVYLFGSLSGNKSKQKQRSLIHKAGSTDPWWGQTFQFTVDKTAALNSCLKFKIEKARRACSPKRDVGEVYVPVRDLLVNGGAGDVKPKVRSCEVRSSSGEIEAVLEISYQWPFPIEVPPVDETVTGYAAAAAPLASNLAVANTPPMPRAAQYPQTAYQPNAVANYPAAPLPAMNANETVTGYPVAPVPPATYQPPMPGAAPYPQTAYHPIATPNYQPQGYVHPPAGYGYAAPPPHAGGNFMQTARPPYAAPTYGYPPPANVHPPARHGHAGKKFLDRVMSRVAVTTIGSALASSIDPGNDDGILSMLGIS